MFLYYYNGLGDKRVKQERKHFDGSQKTICPILKLYQSTNTGVTSPDH